MLARYPDFAALREEAARLVGDDAMRQAWWTASVNGRKAKRRARRRLA